jgi:pimeloyl-ACP methyl ester carboxylesterase
VKLLYSDYAPHRYLPEDFGEQFGEEDRVIPSVYGAAFAERIAGSRLEIIGRCGHIPHVEQLERTLELVSDFLRS